MAKLILEIDLDKYLTEARAGYVIEDFRDSVLRVMDNNDLLSVDDHNAIVDVYSDRTLGSWKVVAE